MIPFPGRFGGVDLGSSTRRHLPPFGMHAVGGDVLDLDRQEGAGADMQGDEVALHASGIEFLEEVRCEMQAGGRGSYGTFLAGVDRLIVRAVLSVFRPLGSDIGRKRDMPDGGDRLIVELD